MGLQVDGVGMGVRIGARRKEPRGSALQSRGKGRALTSWNRRWEISGCHNDINAYETTSLVIHEARIMLRFWVCGKGFCSWAGQGSGASCGFEFDNQGIFVHLPRPRLCDYDLTSTVIVLQ